MAGSKSAFFEANLLNFVFGGGSIWTATASIFHALSTAAFTTAATGASMTEVSTAGTAYARIGLTRNTTNFPAASGSNPASITNSGSAVTWAAATASWGTVLACYIVDVVTVGSGNILYGFDLTVSKTVSTGDTASIATSGETFTEQ